MRRSALVLALFVTLTAALLARPQDSAVFSSSAQLVVLHVNVQDRDGGFVTGLPQDAFAVFENQQRQDVTLFINEDTPVTTGLIIDNSISMRENRELVIAAATEFARASNDNDEIFAVVFNEHVRPALPPSMPFTSDADVLNGALGQAIIARGRTALFDAVTAGLEYAARGRHQRKVLVVISDGGDNASSTTFEQMSRKAQTSNVMIYTVTLVDPLDREANPALMATLAKDSGGLNFKPQNRKTVGGVLQQISRDLRHSYTLGYVSSKPADGAFRPVRVIVTPPANQKLVVRTRGGYLAALPSESHPHD